MKRQHLVLFMLFAVLVSAPISSAIAANGHGQAHGNIHGGNHGFGHGFNGIGRGFTALGVGGDYGYGCDIADLYRQLYQNLPYFALHPPVYYSEPVPRTYGYSPFAYPPGVMTPEIVEETKPVTINNPYVPGAKPGVSTQPKSDRAASTTKSPEPLVINNPFVTPKSEVAKSGT